MSVETMRLTMTGGEFQAWGIYYSVKAQRMELERLQAESRGGR